MYLTRSRLSNRFALKAGNLFDLIPQGSCTHGASNRIDLRLDKHNSIQVQLQLKNKIVLSHHETSAEKFCAGFAANIKLQWEKKRGGGGIKATYNLFFGLLTIPNIATACAWWNVLILWHFEKDSRTQKPHYTRSHTTQPNATPQHLHQMHKKRCLTASSLTTSTWNSTQ